MIARKCYATMLLPGILILALLAAPLVQGETATTAERTRSAHTPTESRRLYDTIVSHLDTGGDLLLVASVEGILDRFFDDLEQAMPVASADGKDTTTAKDVLAKLKEFLDANGLCAAHGFGISAVPVAAGQNTVKSFIGLDPAAAKLPIWQALLGGAPQRLTGLDFLPADTVMARVTATSLARVWQLVQEGVNNIAPAHTASSFSNSLAFARATLGIEIDDLFRSAGDDFFISVQMPTANDTASEEQGILGAGPVPSLLLGMRMEGDTLVNAIESSMAGGALPLVSTQSGDAVLKSISMPLVPFQPTYTAHAGFFLFGTSTNVVINALSAFRDKNGLATTEEFTQAFAGLPMLNNGIVYMTPDFSRIMSDLRTLRKSKRSPHRSDHAGIMAAVLRNMRQTRQDQSCALVIVKDQDGIATLGTSSASGQDIVENMSVVPLAAITAAALPEIGKNKARKQRNICMNRLRRIDAAKEQWALVNGKDSGAVPTAEDIASFTRGTRRRTRCPAGGTYTINPIDVAPECSIKGHSPNTEADSR